MRKHLAFSLIAGAALAGCLGTRIVQIEGTVSGLPSGTSVTLQNNGEDDLVVSANGAFAFSERLGDGDNYSVTVLTQPPGATCSVSNGAGKVGTGVTTISNVAVTCSATATVVGTLTGLGNGASVVLSNGTTTVALATNGPWSFPGLLAAGTAYSVTVANQPANGQVCTVSGGSGTVTAGTATAIAVSCL